MADKEFQLKISINNKSAGKRFFSLKTGESLDHVMLKLVAFIIFFDNNPSIETSVDWRYTPDLVAFDGNGKLNLWVECADVSPEKIKKILHKYHNIRLVSLKITHGDAKIFSNIFRQEKDKEPGLLFMGFDSGFIDSLCSNIYDRMSLDAVTYGDKVEISFDDMKFSSGIYLY
jgi:uncharacterized protein YaeQ